MDALPIVITIASGFVSLVTLVKTVRDAAKEKVISTLAPVLSLIATIFITIVYVGLTGAPIDWLLGVPLLLVGLFIGRGQAAATRVYYRGKLVFGKANMRYLVYWGGAYILTLLLGQLGSAALHAVGILIMLFSLGVAVGSNLILLSKRLTVKPETASPPARMPITASGPPALLPEQGGHPVRPVDLPEGTRGESVPSKQKPAVKPTQLPR